jgi:outer membrane protein assembly factor BamB
MRRIRFADLSQCSCRGAARKHPVEVAAKGTARFQKLIIGEDTMSVVRGVLLSLGLVTIAGNAALAQAPAAGGYLLPSPAALNRMGLTRAWWSHAVVDPTRDKVEYLTADENNVYVQGSNGVVTAFNAETGKLLWSRPVGFTDRASLPTAMNDELLFVVNGTRLFAVRKPNGDIVWELPLPGQPTSTPAIDEYRAYVGFLDGSVYAFDLKKVQELHTQSMLPAYSFQAISWRFRTSQAVTATPLPSGRFVAFASRDGSLYSVSSENSRLLFQFETDAALTAPLVRYKNVLLLASEDYNFYSLNVENGKPGWQFSAGLVIRKAPVLIGDEVYLLPDRGWIFKLMAENGAVQWRDPRINEFLAVSTRRVYAVDHSNNLSILSRADGALLGTMPLGRFTKFLANDRSDRVFVATKDGFVLCLRETGRDFPRFHKYPERQPLLPEFAPDDFVPMEPAESENPFGATENQ